VLTDYTHEVIACSDVRIVDNSLDPNQRAIVTPLPNASADGESESNCYVN
jgi:hypothetical protein